MAVRVCDIILKKKLERIDFYNYHDECKDILGKLYNAKVESSDDESEQ